MPKVELELINEIVSLRVSNNEYYCMFEYHNTCLIDCY